MTTQTTPTEEPTRERWAPVKKHCFNALEPAAMYVAGNDGPEPRRFGDNMGAWPILLGQTRAWEDNVTPAMDRLSPMRERGVLFRVWTPSYEHSKRLMALSEEMIRYRIDQGQAEKLRKSWVDMGPDTDLKIFEFELHDLAKRHEILPWDDDALSNLLDRAVAQARKMGIQAEGQHMTRKDWARLQGLMGEVVERGMQHIVRHRRPG